jgi:uncharacterized protein (TIGR00255 family)
MIKSMTGYGRSVVSNELCDIKIEMKSVNSKYMDINVRTPKIISQYEVEIRNIVKNILKRCKVDIFVEVKPKKAISIPTLNKDLLNTYVSVMQELKDNIGTKDNIKIDHLLQFKDLIEFESNETFAEEIGSILLNSVKDCASSMDEMREKEGISLFEDIKSRLQTVLECCNDIEKNTGEVFNCWNEKFKKRLSDMNLPVEEERIVQEAAIFAEKADITEEIVRIKSHLKQIEQISEKEYPCGKKLDFMSQELHREFNTIGSKSGSVKILNMVVNAKSEIDKIREQIQNIV